MADFGYNQFLDWGTATSITMTTGRVTSGDMDTDSNPQHREGIGAQDSIVGGELKPAGKFTFDPQYAAGGNVKTLLSYGLRSSFTSPSLTDLCFAGGILGNGKKHTGAKIDSMGLKCSIGQALSVDLGWKSTLQAVAYATAPIATLTAATYEWFMGTCTVGSSSLLMQSFDVNVNNNVDYLYSLDVATSNKRFPDSLKVGSQVVTVTFDLLTYPGSSAESDLIADTLAVNIGASIVLASTDTLTITLSGGSRKSLSVPFQNSDGTVVYKLALEFPKNQSGIIAIS